MSIAPAVLQGGLVLGTSNTTLYAAPGGVKAIVKKAVFTNVSGSTATITVAIVRSGGSAITIISAQPVSAGQAYVSAELGNLVLNSGDVVQALASAAASVNAFMSGLTA